MTSRAMDAAVALLPHLSIAEIGNNGDQRTLHQAIERRSRQLCEDLSCGVSKPFNL